MVTRVISQPLSLIYKCVFNVVVVDIQKHQPSGSIPKTLARRISILIENSGQKSREISRVCRRVIVIVSYARLTSFRALSRKESPAVILLGTDSPHRPVGSRGSETSPKTKRQGVTGGKRQTIRRFSAARISRQ